MAENKDQAEQQTSGRSSRKGQTVRVRWPSGALAGEGFPELSEQPQTLTASELSAAEAAAKDAGVDLIIGEA
jgi:hypothetical protein